MTLEEVQVEAGSAPVVEQGDYVRSFDFPDRSRDLAGPMASYVEGTVEAFVDEHDCTRYMIAVEKTVRCGHVVENGPQTVFPPMNGTPRTFGGVCEGVEVVHRDGWVPVLDIGSWAKLMEDQTLVLCPMSFDGSFSEQEAYDVDWYAVRDHDRAQLNALAAQLKEMGL